MSKPKIFSESAHDYYNLGKRSLNLPFIVDKEDILLYDYQNPLHTILQNKIKSFKNKQISLAQKMKENKNQFKSKSNILQQQDYKSKPNMMIVENDLEESKFNIMKSMNSPIAKPKNFSFKQNPNNISLLKEKIYNIDSSSFSQDREIFHKNINLKTRAIRAEIYEDFLFNKFNMTNSTVDTKFTKMEEHPQLRTRENENSNHVITKFFVGGNTVNKWSQPKNKSTKRVSSAKVGSTKFNSCINQSQNQNQNQTMNQHNSASGTSTSDLLNLKNSKVNVLDIKFKNIRNSQEMKIPLDLKPSLTSRSKSKSRKNSMSLKAKKIEKEEDFGNMSNSLNNPYSNFGKMQTKSKNTRENKTTFQFNSENSSKFNLRFTPNKHSSSSKLFIKSFNTPDLFLK